MIDSGHGFHLSQRSAHLREAGLLRALTLRVAAFPDGINLGQGVCDLDMPPVLRAAAIHSIRSERATYTPFGGIPELRAAITRRTRARHGLEFDDNDVVVTIGSSMAYTATLMTLIDPGDEVVLFEPFYPYHRSAAILAGAVVRPIPVHDTSFAVDWTALAAAINRRTRLVVLNTPSNPLGRVWTAAELDRLAALLAPTDAVVVTDEIYEDLVYDGCVHIAPATRPGLRDRTVSISGISKAFSVTGWRLGWLTAPTALARAIGPVFDVMCVCAPRPLQSAVATALNELPPDYYTNLRDGYARRRDLLCAALERGGFAPHRPNGAYYVLADYRARYGSITPRDACFRLLDELHIAAIPADLFFSGAPPHALRFHFAVEDAVIAEVSRRLSGATR